MSRGPDTCVPSETTHRGQLDTHTTNSGVNGQPLAGHATASNRLGPTPTCPRRACAFWSAVLGADLRKWCRHCRTSRGAGTARRQPARLQPWRATCACSPAATRRWALRPTTGPCSPSAAYRPPAWLDASSAWRKAGNPAQDAVAVSDDKLVTLPRVVQALMQRYPELARRLVVTLAQQVQSLTLATHDLMHKDAEGQLRRLAAAALRQQDRQRRQHHRVAERAQARHRVAARHHAGDACRACCASARPQGLDLRGRLQRCEVLRSCRRCCRWRLAEG
ncbi:MAG: hypothetical protein MZW92_00795 [Comamonadaceae bacterium]|nr:hypothetical protein [Comamonadaceae bacterium]